MFFFKDFLCPLKNKRQQNLLCLFPVIPSAISAVSLSAPQFSISQQFLLAPIAHEWALTNDSEVWQIKVSAGMWGVISRCDLVWNSTVLPTQMVWDEISSSAFQENLCRMPTFEERVLQQFVSSIIFPTNITYQENRKKWNLDLYSFLDAGTLNVFLACGDIALLPVNKYSVTSCQSFQQNTTSNKRKVERMWNGTLLLKTSDMWGA